MKAIQKRRAMTGQSGFTLIELLVVIAILGVLAAVVVFAVGGITDNSEQSACEIDERTIKTAIQAVQRPGACRADRLPTRRRWSPGPSMRRTSSTTRSSTRRPGDTYASSGAQLRRPLRATRCA